MLILFALKHIALLIGIYLLSPAAPEFEPATPEGIGLPRKLPVKGFLHVERDAGTLLWGAGAAKRTMSGLRAEPNCLASCCSGLHSEVIS